MRPCKKSKPLQRVLAFLIILLAAVALCPVTASSQNAGKKLSKQDVIDLLTGDVPSARVADIATQKGVAFPMDAATERDIRAANGSDDLIQVLRGLAPRAPSPPPRTPRTTPGSASTTVLMVQSHPGESQVFVDDVSVGTTSPQGKLRLTSVAPGNHQVRLSLSGYEEYVQAVTVTAGQTTTVIAEFQPVVAPPPPVYNTPAPPETPTVSSGQPGFLGVLPMEQQPAGARGVVISGAYPGSPAEQAGIKTYDTILAVGGKPVRTPQELFAALASHQMGEAVQVTWYNGSTNMTKVIRLVNPPQPAQPQVTTPSYPPTLTNMPQTGFASFTVAHDHGQSGQNYCVGIMSIGNGMIFYKSNDGSHTFEIPLNTVKEDKRNAVYLVAMGAFHIKLAKGTNYNFVALNQQGQYQPPDAILTAIDQAKGK